MVMWYFVHLHFSYKWSGYLTFDKKKRCSRSPRSHWKQFLMTCYLKILVLRIHKMKAIIPTYKGRKLINYEFMDMKVNLSWVLAATFEGVTSTQPLWRLKGLTAGVDAFVEGPLFVFFLTSHYISEYDSMITMGIKWQNILSCNKFRVIPVVNK